MSNAIAENLDRDPTKSGLSRTSWRQLLAAIGSEAEQTETQIEAVDYDWSQPHYFNSSQLRRLNDFTKKIAALMAEKFAGVYHSNFNVTVTSITQHFAGDLPDQILGSEQNDYYLAFGSNKENLWGLVGIPEQTAIAWVTELLGEPEPKPVSSKVERKDAKKSDSSSDLVQDRHELQGKVLSQLEESLLFDIASAIVESLAISLRMLSADNDVQPASALVKGQLPIELKGIEEICKIVFGIEKAAANVKDNISQIFFLMPCRRLAPVVDKITEADKKISANDISKAILDHIQRMPVNVTAQLGATELSFEQIMALSPCDILVLDKAIDEPIELVVEGRAVFCGQPAKSGGQHAIVITELSEEDAQRGLHHMTENR